MSIEPARPLPEPLAPDDVLFVYDGVCGLCHAGVRFVLHHDKRGKIRFAALQSPLGERIRAWAGLPELAAGEASGTMIVIDRGFAYTRSSAMLHLTRWMNWPFPLLYMGMIVPRVLRDAMYNFIARHRYQWFGKHDTCSLPAPNVRERFL